MLRMEVRLAPCTFVAVQVVPLVEYRRVVAFPVVGRMNLPCPYPIARMSASRDGLDAAVQVIASVDMAADVKEALDCVEK